MDTLSQSFYVTGGGNLHCDAPSYISRQADNKLYETLKRSEFCYILTSRQMGKSSLMVRAAERLRQEDFAIVNIDLTLVGKTGVTTEQFYDALQVQIDDQLGLGGELEDFWLDQTRFDPLTRFIRGLREVVLVRCCQPIVIFIDEIDCVRGLPTTYTDEFFGAIRGCYTERTKDEVWQRLTFCLVGVATPSELIKNPLMTPFNIGKRIDLTDFTLDEALPLAQGLGREESVARPLLERVLYWTNGHPYLTQVLCEAVAQDATVTRPAGVDRLCEELFLSSRSRNEQRTLQDVRTSILRDDVDHAAVLDLYRQVRRRKRIKDDDTNPIINALRLAGLIRVVDDYLWIRNRIYFRAFDEAWILANMPDAEKRRQESARRRGFLQAAGISAVVVGIMAGLTIWAWLAQERAVENERIAEQQRNIAEQQKSLAMQAVYNLTYGKIEQLLEIPRTKEIILPIFEANVRILTAIADLNPNTPEAQREKSVNLNKIGDIRRVLGDTQAALTAYQQSLEIDKRLAAADPSNTQAQRDVSVSYERLGNVQIQLGDTQAALTAYQQCSDILKRLAAADPSNTQAQRDVSVSYERLGNVQLQLGDTQAALTAYQQSLDIRKRLAAADPSNTQAQQDLAFSYERIGDVKLRLGESQPALDAYQKEFEILERLAKDDLASSAAQRALSVSYNKLGDVQLQLGDTQAALTAYQQSLEIAKRLAAADPSNTQAQRDLAISYHKIADIHLAKNELKEVLESYQQALVITEKLATQDKLNQTLQNALAQVQSEIAGILVALERYPEAVAIYDRLLEHTPDNVDALFTRAQLADKLNRFDQFDQDMKRALQLAPDNINVLNGLGFTLADREMKDRYPEAQTLLEHALTLEPESSYILDSMGWLLYRMEKYPEALERLQQAMTTIEKNDIASENPAAVAESAAHLGEVLWKMGKKAEAKQIWDKALQQFPDDEKLQEIVKRFMDSQSSWE